jgi:uncharacterized protein YjbI with pentapeptide repeats
MRGFVRLPLLVRQNGTLVTGLIAVILVALILIYVPRYQASKVSISGTDVPRQAATLINEYRKTLTEVIGGLFLVLGAISGAYFTLRQIGVTREGQITQRFTNAISQLGDDKKLAVRLGGIYALERIAKDSVNDHWTIIEVLLSFVRANAPITTASETANDSRLPADIQAILTVLGRRADVYEPKYIDLSRVNLRKAGLAYARLPRVDFERSRLEEARFIEAHMPEANFTHAHLERAWLQKADLKQAWFWRAHLEGANLNTANLEEADFSGAHLEGAQLWDANLENADFTKAHLNGTHLARANLTGADLSDANLDGAILTGANVTISQLRGAYVTETTKLPDGIVLNDVKPQQKNGGDVDARHGP